jgi:hypothetical protein
LGALIFFNSGFISGLIQLLGFIKAGSISNYLTNVIEGMLAVLVLLSF